MVAIGIVGGTGYTGTELLRLLALRDDIKLSVLTSRSDAGKKISSVYPWLSFLGDKTFDKPTFDKLKGCDIVFFATPSGVAMQMVSSLIAVGVRIIDLSADFRFRNPHVWSEAYGGEHSCPDLSADAVYGLPELFRNEIRHAKLVANPGCYPTASLLALYPLSSTLL